MFARVNGGVARKHRAFVAGPFVREVLLPFLSVRAAVAFGVWAMLAFTGRSAPFRADAMPWVDALIRWDSMYYLDIASSGYAADNASFFPLYPSMVRVLALVMPVPYAAVLISNACALVALEVLRRLVARDHGSAVAARSVVVALLFPTSFFLSAAYAESTYLAASLVAFLAAREKRFAIAAFAVWLACLARPQGFLGTTLPFGIAWLATDRTVRGFPWFALTAFVALAQLCLVHRMASGDPFAFLHSEGVRSLRAFWGDYAPPDVSIVGVLVHEGFGPNLVRRLLNLGAILLVLGASFAELRAGRIEFAVVGPTMLALPLFFQRTVFDAASMARYALLAFPVYPLLARRPSNPTLRRFVDLAMPILQVVLFATFVGGGWAE